MNISNKNIDGGKAFDWGKASKDYAKFRDIYPQEFYDRIVKRGLCIKNQAVLDIGTGTGVLPRNMYHYGAKWTATDISEEQIKYAKMLSENMNIDYYAVSAESMDFPDNSFDVITACQCFWYFNHKALAPKLFRLLKPNGRFVMLCMEWLPFEDKIAEMSENLVLKYNPKWSGKGSVMQPSEVDSAYDEYFETAYRTEYLLKVPFTREGWNGRMKSCRGIGASLSQNKIKQWEKEHLKMLSEITPPKFEVLHYAAMAELKVCKFE